MRNHRCRRGMADLHRGYGTGRAATSHGNLGNGLEGHLAGPIHVQPAIGGLAPRLKARTGGCTTGAMEPTVLIDSKVGSAAKLETIPLECALQSLLGAPRGVVCVCG